MVKKVENLLMQNDIGSRRYFYPLLSKMDYVNDSKNFPIAEKVSNSILCLPMYFGLTQKNQENIINLINTVIDE